MTNATPMEVLHVWKELGLDEAAKLAAGLDPWATRFGRIVRNGLLWAVGFDGDGPPDCAMWSLLQEFRDNSTIPAIPVLQLIDTRDAQVQYSQARMHRILGPDTPQPDSVSVLDAMLMQALVDQIKRGALDFYATYTPVNHKTALLTPEQQQTRCWLMEQLWFRRDEPHLRIAYMTSLLLHVPCPGNGVFLDVKMSSSAKKLTGTFYKSNMPTTEFDEKAAVRITYAAVPTKDLALALLAVDPRYERVVRVKCSASKKGAQHGAVFVIPTSTLLIGDPPINAITVFDDMDVIDSPKKTA